MADAERAVGIIDYVSPDLLGIGGILKARPADFIVNEISLCTKDVAAASRMGASSVRWMARLQFLAGSNAGSSLSTSEAGYVR